MRKDDDEFSIIYKTARVKGHGTVPTLRLLIVLYRLCRNGLSKPGLAYELPGDELKTLSKRRV